MPWPYLAAILATVAVLIAAAFVHSVLIRRTLKESQARYRALYDLYRELYRRLGEVWWLRHRTLQNLGGAGQSP